MSNTFVIESSEQTVVFTLGDESYCIDIFRVNEIIRLREITPIPGSPSHIKGLVNLRGKTIPVIDLRLRLGLPQVSESDDSRIIVVETEQGNMGIIVDSVREVFTVQPEIVDQAPTLIANIDTDFVRGVAKRGTSLVTMLNLDLAIAA